MLTEERKVEIKTKYLSLLDRIGLKETLEPLLESLNYFEQPATAQYNGAYAGGLAEYALLLCRELGTLCNIYYPGVYADADIIKVALLKEIYRAQMYEVFNRNVKNEETGQWEALKAYRTKEVRPVYGDLGFSSYMILKNYIDLTDEQIEAIIHTTGIASNSVDIYAVLKAYPLVTLTRMASDVVNYLKQ